MFRVTINDADGGRAFVLKGNANALAELVARLETLGHEVDYGKPRTGETLPCLHAAECPGDLPECSETVWLVWNRGDQGEVQREAQERGALSVLDAEAGGSALLHALTHAATLACGTRVRAAAATKRQYERGAQIHLEEDRVVRILRGVVRCTSVHPDGSEVLIGFYGARDILMAHTNYACLSHSCFVEMRAHTHLAVRIEPWDTAVTHPDFHERLKQRICQMELWSSMQARAGVEERLLGILQVIGGRFSKPTPGGLMVDVKLTHEQLAGAVGATRSTVTRLLGALKKQGRLNTVRTHAGEFFVIDPQMSVCRH